MSSAGRKGKNTGDAQQHEGSLPRGEEPVIIEHGKKWAAYDKFGKLIILGYNRRICQEYANDRVRKARQRQKRKSK